MCTENNASNLSKGAKVGFNIIIYFFYLFFLQKSVHHGVFTAADATFKWKFFSFTNFLAEIVAIGTLTAIVFYSNLSMFLFVS